MLRKFAGLAAVALATAACHSGGTYLQNAESMPAGPGVVDCSGYMRTENAYVHTGCWTPAPFSGTLLTSPVAPRAPRVGQPAICEPLQGEIATPVAVVSPAAAVTARADTSRAVPVVTRGRTIETPRVTVAPGRETAGELRTARDTVVRTTPIAVPATPTARVEVTSGSADTIRPGVQFGTSASLPEWDEPIPPPRPGASLPAPRIEVNAR